MWIAFFSKTDGCFWRVFAWYLSCLRLLSLLIVLIFFLSLDEKFPYRNCNVHFATLLWFLLLNVNLVIALPNIILSMAPWNVLHLVRQKMCRMYLRWWRKYVDKKLDQYPCSKSRDCCAGMYLLENVGHICVLKLLVLVVQRKPHHIVRIVQYLMTKPKDSYCCVPYKTYTILIRHF